MVEVKKYNVTAPWLKTACSLGEGPFYDEDSQQLRFLDIENNAIHTVDMTVGASSHKLSQILDSAIGCTANIAGTSDAIAYGGAQGIGILDFKTNKYGYIAKFWNDEEIAQGKDRYMRSNDGAVDPQGRFWVGAMCDPRHKDIGPEGALFRLDADLRLHRILDKVSIPNGMSWTSDGATMYHTDTATGAIDAYDWHGESGAISNKRTFFRTPEGYGGAPDGHTMDIEGHLWVAIYSSSKVVRVSPRGKIVAEVTLPTRNVTCPVLAGEDLIVTSAKEDEPEKYPESAKHAGHVFKVSVGVKGQKPNAFKRS